MWFSENVSKHVHGRAVNYGDGTTVHMLTNCKTSGFNVLSSRTHSTLIAGDGDASLVVFEDRGWICDVEAHGAQCLTEPDAFMHGIVDSDQLGLS